VLIRPVAEIPGEMQRVEPDMFYLMLLSETDSGTRAVFSTEENPLYIQRKNKGSS
jgi:hypothetical protein